MWFYSISLLILLRFTNGQKDTNMWPDRSVMVHLFEWKYNDIADECEKFLAPKGYGGVQVSPVFENVIVNSPPRPWWERYQPMSYKIITRSGNEEEFKRMVKRCNNVGVRIYVDAVLNHMAADNNPAIGTGGSTANTQQELFPAVPYGPNDFHSSPCGIQDYGNVDQVRNCRLNGLHDLDHTKKYVRGKILENLNKLIGFGVAGFRIDAAKHMWPRDLEVIYSSLNNLNTAHGFKEGAKPFLYQEVIDLGGGEVITRNEYTPMGAVTEFKFSAEIGRVFNGRDKLKHLVNWGPGWSFIPKSSDALVFVDNHDNQRGHGPGGNNVLTYKTSRNYKMAVAFMLAHPYGNKRVMSSFDFSNSDQGPPHDNKYNILSPQFNSEGACTNGWICEHRWRQIYNMVEFNNVVLGTNIANWWDNQNQQIAFSRGSKGFIAMTLEGDLKETLQTGLPPGIYCDIISGKAKDNGCTGRQITVNKDGKAYIEILTSYEDPMFATNIKHKIR